MKNPRTLIKFYAPWCGHCKQLAPVYEEAAGQLKAKGISLAKIDATEAEAIAKRYAIETYPTLVWLDGGTRTDYTGERTAAGIVEWVGEMTGPAVRETAEAPVGEPGKLPRMLLQGPSLLAAFAVAAQANRTKAAWYFVQDGGGSARITLQHRGEDPIEMTDGVGDAGQVMSFLKDNYTPLFGVLDGETFARYAGKGLIWTLFPVDSKQGGLAAVEAANRPVMMEVAKRFAGKYSVTYTDTEAFKDNIDSMLGVADFPAVVVQPQAGSKTKFVHTGSMTAEAIIRFLDDVGEGRVAPKLKSEPVPTSDEGVVKVIVGTTLEQEVFTEDKDVMLEIYAPWCGSCKQLWPEYRKLATYIRNWQLHDLVKVAKIDGTANDIAVESLAFSSFPTLYFVPAGSKTPIKYDGERTAKGMWQWVKQRATKAGAIKEIQASMKAKRGSQEL